MHKKVAIIFLLVLTAGLSPAFAQPICNLDSSVQPRKLRSLERFGALAVLSDGRVKPVDTYARTLLLQFSGKTSFERKPAVEWLGRLLFAPQTTLDDKIFLINNPEIAAGLGIEAEPHRRYSFAQLQPGLAKLEDLAEMADKISEKEHSVVEQEVLRVYRNVVLYDQHSEVFSFAFPSPDFGITSPEVAKALGLPEGQKMFSFYDIASRADRLRELTGKLEKKNSADWPARDKELFQLANTLFRWSLDYHDLPFTVVPAGDSSEGWLSPMDAVNRGSSDPKIREEIARLRDMMVYYWNGEQLQFDLAVRSFGNSALNRLDPARKKAVAKIPLELFYNKADLFLWAKLFYALAFFIFLWSFFPEGARPVWRRAACFLVAAGLVPHALALTLRVIIMARPPVSNLYETFIFVSLITVVAGVIIELVNKRWVGNIVASVCGFVFLMVASKFAAEGDTMQMLVAVLNSNFWLGTHVLTITMGYSGVCVAGLVGHLYILQCIRYPKDKAALESTYHNMIGALGFGLMMTFLGT
ncbi:MAG: hypothetical protein HZA29_00270, partial [Candidatus Omnitrophica bacterium]|nr:hypothetical protein [Candidatus Omnitrophota bacterium]